MKKLLFLAVASLFVFTACNQEPIDGYLIKGKISGDFKISEDITGEVILSNRSRNADYLISDTTHIEEGNFIFKGKVGTPEMYYIEITGTGAVIPLFLEDALFKVKVTVDNYKDAKVTGGKSHAIYRKITKFNKSIDAKYELDNLMKEYRDSVTTQERRAEISDIYSETSEKKTSFREKVLKSAPGSYFMFNEIISQLAYYSLEDLEEKFAPFKGDVKFTDHRNYKRIEDQIAGLKKLQPGMPAPDFTQNTPEGNPVSLSSVYSENKVTMIDFWAGWCGPCRQFNPKLVEIYEKYHNRGFEILGVSFDNNRDMWLNAIEKDKLPWIHVSEVKYWDTEPRHLYLINFIPNNVFVDSQGKIIVRQLDKDKIEELLEEHLK